MIDGDSEEYFRSKLFGQLVERVGNSAYHTGRRERERGRGARARGGEGRRTCRVQMHTYVGLRARAFFFFKPGVLRTNNEVSCIEVQDCVVSARERTLTRHRTRGPAICLRSTCR